MTTTNSLCLHCNSKPANRPRRLCWACYYTTGVRGLYPSTSKYASRGHGHHAGLGLKPLPAEATAAEPGSEAKILVLMERCRSDHALHHPDDVMCGPPEPPVEIPEAPFPFGNGMRKSIEASDCNSRN